MKYLAGILLGGFLALVVFGVFVMPAGMQDHDRGCIAANVLGWADCPPADGVFKYLTLHLDAYQKLSSVIAAKPLLDARLIFVALFLIAAGVLGADFLRLPRPTLSRTELSKNGRSPSSGRALVHWLALHENSPTLV